MVFISYKSEEFEQASTVRRLLEARGIPCWMAPDSIKPGSEYGRAITDAIRNCDALVLILTEAAQTSTPVLSEVDLAITFKKTVIPFHLDNSELNDAFLFRIGIFQRIEAAGRLAQGYEELVARARQVVLGGDDSPVERAVGMDPDEKARRGRETMVHWLLLAVSVAAFLSLAVIDVNAEMPVTYIAFALALMEMINLEVALYRYLTPWKLGEDGNPTRRELKPVVLVLIALGSIATFWAFVYANRYMSGAASNILLILTMAALVVDFGAASLVAGAHSPHLAHRYGIQPDGSLTRARRAKLAPVLVALVDIVVLIVMYALGDTGFVLSVSLLALMVILLMAGYLFAPILRKIVEWGLAAYDAANGTQKGEATAPNSLEKKGPIKY